MDKQLKDLKVGYDTIYDKETSNRIKKDVFNRLEEKKAHTLSVKKRATYLSSAAIIVIGLFLGSGFVSPTMANVLSQIPYLDQIYKSMNDTEKRKEDVRGFYEDLFTELVKKDTGVIDVTKMQKFAGDAPSMVILVESEQVKEQNENEFRRTVEKYARRHNINKYSLDVKVGKLNRVTLSDDEKKMMEMEGDIIRTARETLKQHGYEAKGIGTGNKTLTVTIDESKETFDKVENDLKETIRKAIMEKNELNYKVELDRITEIEKTENEWYPIFDSIINETQKNFTEVTGFAYSFHPQPLQIIIKTSLSKGKEGKEQAAVIEEYTRSVTEIKRVELGLENIPYVIIVRDKNHKTLYKKSYE
jgi:translation elongation factor EF-1beta